MILLKWLYGEIWTFPSAHFVFKHISSFYDLTHVTVLFLYSLKTSEHLEISVLNVVLDVLKVKKRKEKKNVILFHSFIFSANFEQTHKIAQHPSKHLPIQGQL